MSSSDLLLIAAGSFLPNNITVWLFTCLRRKIRRDKKNGTLKLLSPRRYYALFESDPHTQYNYHRRMQKFWLINFIPMNVVVGFDVWATLNGHDKIALLMTALLLAINTNYSLYANFDTETGDAHAAYAGIKADEIQASQQGDEDVDDQISSIVEQVEWSLPD
ncbi:MAG: hypothetical protein ACREHG_08220 [Candidatus Saccharimonadales bacterium]